MKLVKIIQSFSVQKTGDNYKEGDEVEISDELAKRHGKSGTGFIVEIQRPKASKREK